MKKVGGEEKKGKTFLKIISFSEKHSLSESGSLEIWERRPT